MWMYELKQFPEEEKKGFIKVSWFKSVLNKMF